MTEATQSLLPVTQADRDAAANAVIQATDQTMQIRLGEADHLTVVQAFARHRISHSLPGDVDAAAAWLFDNRWSVPHPMGCRWHEAPRSTQEAWTAYAKGVAAALTPSPCPGDVGMREPWPGCFSDLQRRRVTTLAKLGLMLSVMESGETAPVEIAEFSVSELYAEVLMALAIEDADDTDMALEEVRDYPDCDIMANQAAFEARAALTPSALSEKVVKPGFQAEVGDWMLECFGPEIAADRLERGDRWTEEALELAQTIPGFTAERAHALVDYVFTRPVGERGQEVGGSMVTLAALCNSFGLNIAEEAERELARVWTKVDAIRAKQAAKPTGSALPVAVPSALSGDAGEGE